MARRKTLLGDGIVRKERRREGVVVGGGGGRDIGGGGGGSEALGCPFVAIIHYIRTPATREITPGPSPSLQQNKNDLGLTEME